MNKHIQQLVEIAKIDNESDSFEPMIKEKSRPLEQLLSTQKSLNANISKLEEKDKELRLGISRSEINIQENSKKLEDINRKSKEVRSDKEARALAIEEDLAKEQIRNSNNEIERLNKELDAIKIQKEQLQIQYTDIESKITQSKVDTQHILEDIYAQQKALFEKKQQAITQIDRRVITFYESIRKWAKNTSIVSIKRQACGGCFIRINDRLYAELSSQTNEILTCPHCGRILYIDDNA